MVRLSKRSRSFLLLALPLLSSFRSSYVCALVIFSRNKHENPTRDIRCAGPLRGPYFSLDFGLRPSTRAPRTRVAASRSANTPTGAHLGLPSFRHRKITTCENSCDSAYARSNARTGQHHLLSRQEPAIGVVASCTLPFWSGLVSLVSYHGAALK